MVKSVNQSWKHPTQWLPWVVWAWHPQHKTKCKTQDTKPCVPAFPRHCPYHVQWNYALTSSPPLDCVHCNMADLSCFPVCAHGLQCLAHGVKYWRIFEWINKWTNQWIHEWMFERCFWKLSKWSEVAQSCPTLCDPVDCSLPGFSIHRTLQAGILEWIAIS